VLRLYGRGGRIACRPNRGEPLNKYFGGSVGVKIMPGVTLVLCVTVITIFSALENKYAVEFKTYMCVICGFLYEEEKGLPEEGFAPGTRWEDIPDTWICPDCDAGKEDFEMVEI